MAQAQQQPKIEITIGYPITEYGQYGEDEIGNMTLHWKGKLISPPSFHLSLRLGKSIPSNLQGWLIVDGIGKIN